MASKRKNQKKVLIFYTGGTFGMTQNDRGLKIARGTPRELHNRLLHQFPELKSLAQCDIKIALNRDSAHVGPSEWIQLAGEIQSHWKDYDGVVILHGTDTLAYTASALSFLLRPCLKPVILTGAQRPITSVRTDARRNLISAVEIAANGPSAITKQVLVFFDDRLLQGNRVRKRSAADFAAFESPRVEPLAWVGTEVRFSKSARIPRISATPRFQSRFDQNVAMVHVTPGFASMPLGDQLLSQLSALILIVFPSGTGPTHDPDFLNLLKRAKMRQLPVILVTEGAGHTSKTGHSAHHSIYEAGQKLIDEGGVLAGEMTPECAYVKTMLLLGQSKELKQFLKLWKKELAGEGI